MHHLTHWQKSCSKLSGHCYQGSRFKPWELLLSLTLLGFDGSVRVHTVKMTRIEKGNLCTHLDFLLQDGVASFWPESSCLPILWMRSSRKENYLPLLSCHLTCTTPIVWLIQKQKSHTASRRSGSRERHVWTKRKAWQQNRKAFYYYFYNSSFELRMQWCIAHICWICLGQASEYENKKKEVMLFNWSRGWKKNKQSCVYRLSSIINQIHSWMRDLCTRKCGVNGNLVVYPSIIFWNSWLSLVGTSSLFSVSWGTSSLSSVCWGSEHKVLNVMGVSLSTFLAGVTETIAWWRLTGLTSELESVLFRFVAPPYISIELIKAEPIQRKNLRRKCLWVYWLLKAE